MNEAQHHDLEEVLHLTPKQVSTGLALFYVCYVVFDFPSNLIMTRLSPRVWMSRIVIGVGIIGSCMAAMKAAWSLYLLRLLLGIVIAGMWPGMAYYLTLFYPPSRTGKRIGQYFTAAQVSAAVVGLVSAGFQKMDGLGGLVGFQWMFLLYGLVGILVGFSLLWWLPDRPLPPGEVPDRTGWHKWIPQSKPALTGEDALIHYRDLTRVYHRSRWGVKDLWHVVIDWRVWPLLLMYFGVVGVGIGVQNYATVIIQSTNSKLTSIDLSLLTAPIWIVSHNYILVEVISTDGSHTDGSYRNPPSHAFLRSFPSPPRALLQRTRLHTNRRSPPNHLRRQRSESVATIRRSANGRVRTGTNGPHHHDMDQRDLPAPPWRSRRRGCFRTSIWTGKFGIDFDHLHPLYRLAGRQ